MTTIMIMTMITTIITTTESTKAGTRNTITATIRITTVMTTAAITTIGILATTMDSTMVVTMDRKITQHAVNSTTDRDGIIQTAAIRAPTAIRTHTRRNIAKATRLDTNRLTAATK